jgi:hypothetical protein
MIHEFQENLPPLRSGVSSSPITVFERVPNVSSLLPSSANPSKSNRPQPMETQTLDPKMLTQPQVQSTQFYDLSSPTSSLPTQSQRSWYNTQPGGRDSADNNDDNNHNEDDAPSARPEAAVDPSNKTQSQETPAPAHPATTVAVTTTITTTTTATGTIEIPTAIQAGARPEGWRSGKLTIPPPPPPSAPASTENLSRAPSAVEDQTSQYLNLPSSSPEHHRLQEENSQQNDHHAFSFDLARQITAAGTASADIEDASTNVDPFELQTQAFYDYPTQQSYVDDE